MHITVRHILAEKGNAIVTVTPSVSLEEAARVLQEHHIGAVVVLGVEGRIAGIFTERDLASAIGRLGAKALAEPVSAFMTATVHRCSEETTVNELMELMSAKRFRHVPVESNGKLIGIISIGDVVKQRIREVEAEAEHFKAYIAG